MPGTVHGFMSFLQPPFEVVPILQMGRLTQERLRTSVELRHKPKHLDLNALAIHETA